MTTATHTFHIPVMGTGFTIDTPLKVAQYGIASVIQIVDDVLIEQMRRLHCERLGSPYVEITDDDEDARARRITAYLDMIGAAVDVQVDKLRKLPFAPDSDLTRYFEMLPDSPLRRAYNSLQTLRDANARNRLEAKLRGAVVAGAIDVNLMTKVDRDPTGRLRDMPEMSDALSGLRGFARSKLRSSVVFSAGLNPRLYSYLASFPDFMPDSSGELKKRIVLKVSDFRSALVQGKFLAKKGLWVSEYRVESGLNCGGHTFPTVGKLLGPIMDEFRKRRGELVETLHDLRSRNLPQDAAANSEPPPVLVTVQGGIGTGDEQKLMIEHYQADTTGWGTPFLLVPEVTNVDAVHLDRLLSAGEADVSLSDSSPFGIPFWMLENSSSEQNRQQRIEIGKPGSACPKGYLALYNTEFSKTPICVASRAYQRKKLAQLAEEPYTDEQRAVVEEGVLAKACLCRDLAGGALVKNEIDFEAFSTICTGPNIVNFSQVATLHQMVDHIYDRASLMTNPDRPHMLIRESQLYLEFLRKELATYALGISDRKPAYFHQFADNLAEGLSSYEDLAETIGEAFRNALKTLKEDLEALRLPVLETAPA